MSKKELEIQGLIDTLQREIENCDAAHWPNVIQWADELRAKQSRSIVENLVLCFIELEARKRDKGDKRDSDNNT